jgi:ligand-binding sensor domain-containing protein
VVWFGSAGGASRFDGTIWKTYTSADSLADNDVMPIAEALDGTLWFDTWAGMSHYMPPL